jgi:hypothetical protein
MNAMQPRSRTMFLASMLAPFSTKYRTASTLPQLAASWSGVRPFCAQASQVGGNETQHYAAPLTHVVLGLDVGALLNQVPDSVHLAKISCLMEQCVSILRISESEWRSMHANALTHCVFSLDVGALVNQFTQLLHIASAAGSNKHVVKR